MAQKIVNFEVAKAIKEDGYPQGRSSNCYNAYTGEFHYTSCSDSWLKEGDYIDAPTYLDVWLWLWREKGFRFELAHPEYKGEYDFNKLYCNVTSGRVVTDDYSDPEEPIVAAIDYLVANDLIK